MRAARSAPTGAPLPHVVIAGAGFGGLAAAQELRGAPLRVTVVDRNNYHSFFPLLYQVAAAELGPEEIAYPARGVLRRIRGAEFVLGEIRDIDFERRILHLADVSIPYDYLVLALGSTTHFFGVSGAAEHAFCLRTVDEGIALRNHILGCFERAIVTVAPKRRRALLHFAIAGGGPTGIEFAGALSELIQGPLRRDYPNLDFGEVRITLLEAASRVLGVFPEKLAHYAERRLRKLGVEILTGARVTAVSPDGVALADGSRLASATVVWTAGVKAPPETEGWDLPRAAGGRLLVEPTLRSVARPEVFVAGDLALCADAKDAFPMVAPAAIQQGRSAARNILRHIRGEPLAPFRYVDYGMMATVGRNAGVANLFGRWAFSGFIAWLMWLFIHLLKLVGFRNRLVVLLNWAWSYVFYEKVSRLLLGEERAMAPRHPSS
ncbi:MAG: NAD(P)/FAD-dependent oxidoreductase [Planctomycetes bacterium]|nr:NAD(P)/FAD-dependent oxidoreductase [Planctomycetota bacterium]